MTARIYKRDRTALVDAVDGVLSERLGVDESFVLGLQAADRIIRRDSRLILTDRRVLLIRFGLIDRRCQSIPLAEIDSVDIENPKTGLPTLQIQTPTQTERFEVRTPPKRFVEALNEQRQ